MLFIVKVVLHKNYEVNTKKEILALPKCKDMCNNAFLNYKQPVSLSNQN